MNKLEKQLKDLLWAGKVSFIYKKKDGTEREARGTLNRDMIVSSAGDESSLPKGMRSDASEEDILNTVTKTGSISYFDLDKISWRSFQIGSLVRINN